MAAEVIGAIQVDIVGDYSQLQQDIDSATQIAAAGGEKVAGAFNSAAQSASTFEDQVAALVSSGSTLAEALASVQDQTASMASGMGEAGAAAATAAEQLTLFDEAAAVPYADAAGQLNLFATELEPIGEEAQTAAQGMGEARDALGRFASTASEAEAETASMSELVQDLGHQFLALAEAFVITEGLREFGAEALHASDSLTRANIALTTITGSAERAEETLKGIEALGLQDGLSLPSLQQAATRMQQLLGAGTEVVPLLASIANGAAVMGTDIGTAADMFDRMAANGTVMSRSLGSIGLTMQSLADAVNKVNPELDATALNLTKVFKSMDQEDRINALKTAFQGLAGTAQKVAEETFGGQWQQLSNQFEQIMADVGTAILPVISELLDLVKTDIAPWIKETVEAFEKLPEPLKDTVVGVGLLAAALPPLLLAMGTFGLALTGVSEVMPILTGMMESLGLKSAATAAAEVAATEATAALGVAQGAAAVEMGTLAGAGNTLNAALSAVSGTGAALMASPLFTVALYAGLAAAIIDVAMAYRSWAAAQDLLTAAQKQGSQLLAEYEIRLQQHGIDISALSAQYSSGQISLQQYMTALNHLRDSYLAANPVVESHAAAVKAVLDPVEALRIKTQSLQNTVTSTAAALAKAQSAYDGTATSAATVAKAYDAWTAATNALKGAHEAALPVLTGFEIQTHAFVAEIIKYPDAATAAIDASQALTIELVRQYDAVVQLRSALDRQLEHFKQYGDNGAVVVKMLNELDAANRTLFSTLENAAPHVIAPWTQGFKDAKAAMAELIPAVQQLPPYVMQLNDDMKALGISASELGETIHGKLISAYLDLANQSGATLQIEDAGWQKISGDVNKLAKTDLPAALALYDQHIAQLQKLGANELEILANEQKRLQLVIDTETQNGESATKEIVGLNNIKLAQQALIDHSQLMGKTIVAVENDIIGGFENMGGSIAKVIVEGGSMLDAFKQIGIQIAENILKDIINSALKSIVDSIITSVIPAFATTVPAVGAVSTSIGAMQTAMHTATAAMSADLSSLTAQFTALSSAIGGAGAAGGAGGGGGLGGAAGLAGAIGSVVSAISSIIGNFQMAHLEKIDGEIEQNTRYLQIQAQKFFQADSWQMHTEVLAKFDAEYDRLGDIWNCLIQGFSGLIQSGVAGGAGGSGAPSPQVIQSVLGTVNGQATATSLPLQPGTNPTAFPQAAQLPSLPTLSNPSASSPGAQTYSASGSAAPTGPVTFNVYAATDPRETARQIASTMKSLSPHYAAYSQ